MQQRRVCTCSLRAGRMHVRSPHAWHACAAVSPSQLAAPVQPDRPAALLRNSRKLAPHLVSPAGKPWTPHCLPRPPTRLPRHAMVGAAPPPLLAAPLAVATTEGAAPGSLPAVPLPRAALLLRLRLQPVQPPLELGQAGPPPPGGATWRRATLKGSRWHLLHLLCRQSCRAGQPVRGRRAAVALQAAHPAGLLEEDGRVQVCRRPAACRLPAASAGSGSSGGPASAALPGLGWAQRVH